MTETQIPDGHYAVLDPSDASQMTYWKAKDGKVTPWPAKAQYGPVLLRSEVPKRSDWEARIVFIETWAQTVLYPYMDRIRDAIVSDPDAAAARFSGLTNRCHNCRRVLTDEASKVYATGPECRKNYSPEMLAMWARAVGRAHAKNLAQQEVAR